MLEVELKIRVPSLEEVREELKNHHAESRGRLHEHDIYYNAPHRDFAVTDEAVRVRYTDDHAVVTYKGPKMKNYTLKAREEVNFAVESGAAFETMLSRLGFTKTAEVNKWRENFALGEASISLDTVEELGTFAEIEIITGPGDTDPVLQIEKLAQEIGVKGEPILASYLELLLEKRAAGK